MQYFLLKTVDSLTLTFYESKKVSERYTRHEPPLTRARIQSKASGMKTDSVPLHRHRRQIFDLFTRKKMSKCKGKFNWGTPLVVVDWLPPFMIDMIPQQLKIGLMMKAKKKWTHVADSGRYKGVLAIFCTRSERIRSSQRSKKIARFSRNHKA